MIEISPMEEGEERQTYELILRVFHECVAPVYSKEGIARFLGMLSPDGLNETSNGGNSFIILAKDQSIIVGMLSVINESHRALVFVGPEHQRKGIGKNLIDNAIKKCLKRNPDLSAITVSASPNSRSSYEKIDFKAQGDEIDEDGMRFTPMQTST